MSHQTDVQSTTSSSSDGEMDYCNLSKSAYIANQNSPIIENSIYPYNTSNDSLVDDEPDTMYLGDN